MTLLAFVLIVAAVVAMVAYLRHEVRRAAHALEVQYGEAAARQSSLAKQGKALGQRQAQVTRASAKAVDEARKLTDESQHLRDTANALLSDPRIKRLLDAQGGEG